jgi:hypothetical protein
LAHKLYKSAEASLIEIRQLLPPAAQNGVGARAEIPVGVQEQNGHGAVAVVNGNGKAQRPGRSQAGEATKPVGGVNRIAGRLNGNNRVGKHLDLVGAGVEV